MKKKQCVPNENNEKVTVQIHLKTFEKIENLFEDYVLAQKMKDVEGEEALILKEAETHYHTL